MGDIQPMPGSRILSYSKQNRTVAAQRDPGSVEPMQTRVGRHETTERALGEYGECSVPTHAA